MAFSHNMAGSESTKLDFHESSAFAPEATTSSTPIKIHATVANHDNETKDNAFSKHANTMSLPTMQPKDATRLQLFEWSIAECKVKLRRGSSKVILKDVVGCARAGTFSAIIGPSGCGKTTLLDCLALRNPTFQGSVRLDGHALSSDYFLQTGYVHQKELFFSHLTAREHLYFHAVTRLSGNHSSLECLSRVETVLQEVDMIKVCDTQIGGGELYVTKGLSGGERKRLNIATELLANPSILLLDEPTSGLDSVMGELICLLLNDLARREPKRTVVVAVHSPPSRIFTLFSLLTVLTSNGELAYFGERNGVLPFVESLGYSCPSHFNPADFILELASTKIIQNHISCRTGTDEEEKSHPLNDLPKAGSSSSLLPSSSVDSYEFECGNLRSGHNLDRVERYPPQDNPIYDNNGNGLIEIRGSHSKTSGTCEDFDTDRHISLMLSRSSPVLVAATKVAVVGPLQAKLGMDNCHHKVCGMKSTSSSYWALFKMNLKRSWLQESREKVGLAVRAAMNITLGMLFGLLYLNQIPHDTGRNTAGFLFSLLVTILIASSVNVCLYFPFDFAILMREYYAGANRPGPYFLGRTLASLPQSMLFLLMGIIPYFMAGLSSSASGFGYFCLILFLANFAAQSLGYVASSLTSNPVVGLALLPLLITPMILFSGMLYERHSVPTALQWLQDISVINYSFAVLALNQVQAVGGHARSFLFNFLQVEPDDFSLYMLKLALLAMAYRLLAMGILLVRVRVLSKPQ